MEQTMGDAAAPSVAYQRGQTLAAMGRHEEAIPAFDKLLAMRQSYPWGYWYRGLSHEQLGNRALARADFEKCAQLLTPYGKSESARETVAKVHAKLQEYEAQK